ncbi:hypothetical protein ACF1BN_20310 [Streptomyces sp. NPDC014861]|uniref:hypothetical protein n=1 Tax=Streptomyces sp. NPDC014861 TaxID=3364923 RepID=UPI0036FCD66D
MTAFRQYFEDNPEIFAALVAAIAILGGLLGSVIGAKIQANGGRAQADAAQKAAEIAAEAQRVAALWNVRQLQVAEFIRCVREAVATSQRLYEAEPDDQELRQLVHAAYQAIEFKAAELILIATEEVVNVVEATLLAAEELEQEAMDSGPTAHAEAVFTRLYLSRDMETARAARVAQNVLNAETGETYESRTRALRGVPGLSETLAHELAVNSGGGNRLQWIETGGRKSNVLEEKLAELVRATRTMLRSEDDVAPATPEPRRRWWRAA